jgi:hypothetical protein
MSTSGLAKVKIPHATPARGAPAAAMAATDESGPKLTQVMVSVKIRKAHPGIIGHLAKLRMRLPLEIPRLTRKAIEKSAQFAHVLFKLSRRSAAGLLVQLRHGAEAFGPRDGDPNRKTAQKHGRDRAVGRLDFFSPMYILQPSLK